MQYGYGSASDERIKTNIKTIENALDKTLLLRGVEYNDIRIEPEKKKIGLIAQEVELIIPEVVRTSEGDTATLYLATPYTTSSAYKSALIAEGINTYSRSKLNLLLQSIPYYALL